MMMTTSTRFASPSRPRWGLLAVLAVLHVLAIIGLARVFAPDLSAQIVDRAAALVTVTLRPEPRPTTEPIVQPSAEPDDASSPAPASVPEEGAAGDTGREAVPRPAAAPEPRIPLQIPSPIPRVASIGPANSSGAAAQGDGTGGAQGEGTGSGRSGSGQGDGAGGGPVSQPVKVAGDISNAGDYPVPPGGRAARLGHSVTIAMTVTIDGRATDCRVLDPSPDPEADRITCALAEQRFRFRPARNAAGDPVAASYGWRQSWFRK